MSTNIRRYYELWFLPILIVQLVLFWYAFDVKASDTVIEWRPVCRHKTLYWASVVGEQYPVRIVYGMQYASSSHKFQKVLGKAHVQPQVKLGDHWYYFKVENDKVVLIDMQDFVASYGMTFLQFAEVHNHWILKEFPLVMVVLTVVFLLYFRESVVIVIKNFIGS